jgi:hypothetical protein
VVLLPNPWVALIVLVAIPILIQSKSGPALLTKRPYAPAAWSFLIVIASAGIIRGPWLANASIGMIATALFAAPLVQATLFLILYRGFSVFARRTPLLYDEARRGRQPNGRRHIADRVFWLSVWLIVFITPCIVCFNFGVEFPSRYHFR